MENASKALLIAGSVLIVILLIAVGMMIYNGARGTVDESIAQMSSQQIEAFNAQFTATGLDRVTGTQVLSLQSKVDANNVQNPAGTSKNVALTVPANIQPSAFYHVTYTKDATTGLITTIAVAAGATGGSIVQN